MRREGGLLLAPQEDNCSALSWVRLASRCLCISSRLRVCSKITPLPRESGGIGAGLGEAACWWRGSWYGEAGGGRLPGCCCCCWS